MKSKKNIILLSFVILYSCGSYNEATYPNEIAPYIEKFKVTTNISVNNTDMYIAIFPEYKKEITGGCYSGLGTNVVFFNYTKWETFPEWKKNFLVAHELGHCVLGMSHNDNLLEDGCPQSVMVSGNIEITEVCFNLHSEEYYNELIEEYKNLD